MKSKKLSSLIVTSIFFVAINVNAQTTWNLIGNSGTTPGTNFVGTTDAKALIFKTTNVERMQLSAVGNLRIGAPVAGLPGAKLSFNDVNDVVNGTGNDGITWYSPTPLNYGIYKTAGSFTAPNYQQLQLNWITGIVLNPGTAYGKSFVDIQGGGLRVSSGNVGIGTLTPTFAKLVVQPNSAINNTPDSQTGLSVEKQTTATTTRRLFMVPHLQGWGYNQLSRDGDFGMFWADAIAGGGQNSTAGLVIAPFAFPNNGIRITALGNVGIGTALDVNPSNFRLSVAAFNTGSGIWVQTPTGASYGIKTDVTDDATRAFVITKAGVENFKVLGNGNVYARQITVQLTTFPDYVFKKDYKLKSLSEVEKYINTNGRLPETPSADEIECKGGNLGELVKLQMRKIEELTLYVIEQNKQINEQKQRIEALEAD